MPGVVGRFPNTNLINDIKKLIKKGNKCRLVSSNKEAINALVTPVRVVYFNGNYKLNYYYQNFSKINSIRIEDILVFKAPDTGLV